MLGRKSLALFAVCVTIAAGARPAAAEVAITINGGRVSVSAKNATVAQILAEWARVGQTKIVNAERVSSGPMTLELSNVSELEAIEILLRTAGGYLLAPRHLAIANTSLYDRILILPPSSPVATVPRVASAPSPVQQPRPFAVPPPGPLPQPGVALQSPSDDNDDPPERSNVATPAVQSARPPVFNTFPQAAPQRPAPPPPTAPTSAVTAPVGVAVPGMVAPTPQTNQPGVVAPAQPR